MRASSPDVSDLIRDSFTLSRDLVEEVLGDVDGSVIAQAGDSGSRVADDLPAEKNEQLELFSFNNGEANGKLAASPLPTDAILHSGLTNQIEINRSSSSLKVIKERLTLSLTVCFMLNEYLQFVMPLEIVLSAGKER